jgi:hypothetical protein
MKKVDVMTRDTIANYDYFATALKKRAGEIPGPL